MGCSLLLRVRTILSVRGCW